MTFAHILNLSIRASWLAVAVMGIRPVLKKAPRGILCCLWALVAIRLLCPFSIESPLSLLPSRELISQEYLLSEPSDPGFSGSATLELITNPIYDQELSIELSPTVDRLQTYDLICTLIWLTGMVAMAVYAAFSYLSLRLRVRMAAWVSGSIFECDGLDSPFILGSLRPRIYLPSELDWETRAHVLAHEQSHLARLDHLWKPLGFVLLAVHWFNPILWAAYALLCRDIELACDERVVKNLDKPQILAYSDALIRCSVLCRSTSLCPLAFGEVGVKSRIRAILRYKKPGFWVILTALILTLALAVGFLTDPAEPSSRIGDFLSREDMRILAITGETVTLEIDPGVLPERALNGRTHRLSAPPLVLQYGSTGLYLTEAKVSGDEMVLTLRFRHEQKEDGTLLLPYNPNGIDSASTVIMDYWETAESGAVLGGTIRILDAGTDFLRIAIQLARWNNSAQPLRFRLDGLIHLEYTLEPGILTEPHQSIQLEIAELYRATELPSFTAPEFQLNPDGTFVLGANAFTSYLARGTYTIENGLLEMRTDDGRFVYFFTWGVGEVRYRREGSSEIEYYIDARTPAALPDGTGFQFCQTMSPLVEAAQPENANK